jgi:hypothetical protein
MLRRTIGSVLLVLVTVGVVGGTAYAVLLGCGGSAPPAPTVSEPVAPAAPAEVGLATGGGYGKAVFVVYPSVPVGPDHVCYVTVPTAEGSTRVDCDSQYIIVCDREIPTDRPFCTLVSEIGSDRESAYPKHKRQ